jgi:hypothetical protein
MASQIFKWMMYLKLALTCTQRQPRGITTTIHRSSQFKWIGDTWKEEQKEIQKSFVKIKN